MSVLRLASQAGPVCNPREGTSVVLYDTNLAVHVNRAIDDWPAHTAGGHLLSVVQAATNRPTARL